MDPCRPAAAGTLAELMRKDRTFRVRQAAARSLAFASPPPKSVQADLNAVAAGPKDDLAFRARFAPRALPATKKQ